MRQNLEEILTGFKKPPNREIDELAYVSRFEYMPTDIILEIIGFNNYREHSLKETNTLSKSIKTQGLLEPITLAYDTKQNIWDFIDGEGRFWACYQNGADEIPVEIYYDVPEHVRLRMKIASNSTKTKIDSEDLARFTKELYNLLEEYGLKHSGELEGLRDVRPSIKGISRITNRAPSTIKKYMVFNNLDEEVREYVNKNREKNLYSRSVKIGRTLHNPEHQRIFFNMILKEELERNKRLSDYEFRTRLKKFLEYSQESKDELQLKQFKENPNAGNTLLKHISLMTSKTKRYIDSFGSLIDTYPEIKKDSRKRIEQHLEELKEKYNTFMNILPEKLATTIKSYLEKAPEKSFRDKILEQAEKRRKSLQSEINSNRVNAIGEKVLFIPVSEIVLRPSQLRSRYKQESIDSLVEEIKAYGQIKPGLVREVMIEGQKKYEIIYGHTRFKAVSIAGKKYYKAFVRNDLSDLEISLLQSVEDLSEHDTAAERAKVLNKQFNLMKLRSEHEGKAYEKKDFLKDFNHLGTRKTLKDALEFMELDEHLRNIVHNRIIGYEAALKIGRLSEEDRLNVLYNVMTSQMKGQSLEKYIRKVKDLSCSGQTSLFADIPKSYCKVLEQFEGESMRPFNYILQYLKAGNEHVLKRILRPEVIVQYAKIYKSILGLERKLQYQNGF
jgi:ParB/RepB/Spo0J family partition protein